MKKNVIAFLVFACLLMLTKLSAQSGGTDKVIIDNAKMKVTEYNSQPGEGVCGKGVHSHPAHLTVLLTDADVILTANGKEMRQHAPAGATFWSEAETHTVINGGKGAVKAYIIESKN